VILWIFLRFFIFFFQAEDGIRDFHVTGVQTCALPIFSVFGTTGEGPSIGLGERRAVFDVLARCGIAGDRITPGVTVSAVDDALEIGRASCRKRVERSVAALSAKASSRRVTGERRVVRL